ncbi:hypothetical protein ACOMHN_028396 [Nucella lapillus]
MDSQSCCGRLMDSQSCCGRLMDSQFCCGRLMDSQSCCGRLMDNCFNIVSNCFKRCLLAAKDDCAKRGGGLGISVGKLVT